MDLLGNTLIQEGGYTLYPLFVLSIIAMLIFIERALFLHKGQIHSLDFLAGIKNLINKKRLVEALTLCEETPGPLARVVKSALLQYGANDAQIRSAIESAALIEVPILERRIGSLAAIARIAPLVGFIGTLIAAFRALINLEAANAESALFVQSLAQAIISSAVGLGIAALAALGYHFLHGRVRALVFEIERVGHAIYEFLPVISLTLKPRRKPKYELKERLDSMHASNELKANFRSFNIASQLKSPHVRLDALPLLDLLTIALLFGLLFSRMVVTPGVRLDLPETNLRMPASAAAIAVLTVQNEGMLLLTGVYISWIPLLQHFKRM